MATTTKQDELLAIPLAHGDGSIWLIRNLTKGTQYVCDTLRRTCGCRHGEVWPGRTCKHLAKGDQMDEEIRAAQDQMPLTAARAIRRATGERVLPRVMEMEPGEVREALGTVSIAGWSEKTEAEKKAVFA